MRERTKVIAAAAAVTAALAVGGGAAVASMTGAKPHPSHGAHGTHAKSVSASQKQQRQGHDAIVAAVAAQLHVSTTLVSAALRPIFAAGHADPTSSSFAAAARTLGVSTRQLASALTHAKLSLAPDAQASQSQKPGDTKSAPGSKSAEERQGHDAIVAAVAAQLHVSPARVSAALRPIFAAGHADSSSPTFAAAARALGVSTQQLASALTHAKLSLAQSAQSS